MERRYLKYLPTLLGQILALALLGRMEKLILETLMLALLILILPKQKYIGA
jgi:hypothetical protein